MRNTVIRLAAVWALSVLWAGSAFGQALTGTLLGGVTDPSGAIIVGAQVTVKNQDTGISRIVTTGPDGNYTVPNLAPGSYSVAVKYTGFETGVSDNNIVQVQQTTRVDFKIRPGRVTQQVTVT
jgi:hypothetical protein